MLTIKQLLAEAKRREVEFVDAGSDYYQWSLMKATPDFKSPEYKKFKEQYLKDEEEQNKEDKAHHKKYYADKEFLPWKSLESDIRESFQDQQNDGDTIGFNTDQHTFTCAVEAFGDFTRSKNLLTDHWDLLLQWYVRNSDRKYFMCSTPDRKAFHPLMAGLEAAGFKNVAAEKSNMGKYKVFVWEYIKK